MLRSKPQVQRDKQERAKTYHEMQGRNMSTNYSSKSRTTEIPLAPSKTTRQEVQVSARVGNAGKDLISMPTNDIKMGGMLRSKQQGQQDKQEHAKTYRDMQG